MAGTLPLINLTPDEIENLPARLRAKIRATPSPMNATSGAWFLVGSANEDLSELIERAVDMLPAVVARRSDRLTDDNIEKMLDVFLSDTPRAPVETELDIDNASLRAEYLQDTPCLTGTEVHAASGLKSRNKSEARLPLETRGQAVCRAPLGH